MTVSTMLYSASSLLQALYSMVDTVIAGHFAGSAAISAINNSGQILNILTKIAIGITTGGNIIIGQYYGAKEQGRLGEASGTLLSLSLLLGAATALGLYAGAYPLLGLLGAPAMEQSVAYLRICAVGMVFVFGYNALSAVLRGVGDSRTPLLIIGVATVVNTVLDLWFVAGLGMGTAGAALATTAAQAVSFGMALVHNCSFPMVVELCSSKKIGKFTGYYYTASMSAQTVTPILLGFLFDMTGAWRALPIYACVMTTLSAIVFISLVKNIKAKKVANVVGIEALDSGD